MPAIQALYVGNHISRKKHGFAQELSFCLQLENRSYAKEVVVHWRDTTGRWHELAAQYAYSIDNGLEVWNTHTVIQQATLAALPGDIVFYLRYTDQQQTYIDDFAGQYHRSAANSGISLCHDLPLLNLHFTPQIYQKQVFVPITVAVSRQLAAKSVTLLWTTDNWQSSFQTPCQAQKIRIGKHPPASQLWTAKLNIAEVFNLEYCVCAETAQGKFWDNHHDLNYRAKRKDLCLLILNLHCYQETEQDAKFSLIAKAIAEREVDIVCLQEVAEYWNDGQGDWPSNSANIINSRLPKPFHLVTDWSHRGFDQYREGVAILSRFPMTQTESRYVSASHDPFDIHSRKVVYAQIDYPAIGSLNVFSAHLSWWENGFSEQYANLSAWAAEKDHPQSQATLLCGDFNIAAGSRGYDLIVRANEYEDQFLSANAHGVFEKIFKVNDPYWQHSLDHDYRIDYVFMHKHSKLQVTSASVLFTEHDYGRVSDHCGYLLSFEPK